MSRKQTFKELSERLEELQIQRNYLFADIEELEKQMYDIDEEMSHLEDEAENEIS